ncbi:MAG: hypothetical protein WAZ34_15975 [Rhodocyclaceae bacterium]
MMKELPAFRLSNSDLLLAGTLPRHHHSQWRNTIFQAALKVRERLTFCCKPTTLRAFGPFQLQQSPIKNENQSPRHQYRDAVA